MNILIKGKHENFVIPFKSHERDFCYDCVAVSKTYIDDNRIQYGLGFSLEIDPEDPMYESMKDDFIFSFDFRFLGCLYFPEFKLQQGKINQ